LWRPYLRVLSPRILITYWNRIRPNGESNK
jgi:hypothetical protein